MIKAGRDVSLMGGGTPMEFNDQSNRPWKLASLLLTVAVVGGAIAFAFSAG
jgi:hypothetical protein